MMLPYKNCIKTITCDNGREFSDFKRIEKKFGIQIYFAHPYCSWERGLSEHTNGLVRQYIPKETDFKDVTNQEIKKYQYKINNRPRKVLMFKKPKDLFYQKVIWKIALDGGMDAISFCFFPLAFNAEISDLCTLYSFIVICGYLTTKKSIYFDKRKDFLRFFLFFVVQ